MLYQKQPKESLHIILVEVDKKRLSLVDYNSGIIISTYPIATGKSNSPTPLGSFKIIQKSALGEGFGSRWLGLNVPWGNYGPFGNGFRSLKPGDRGADVLEVQKRLNQEGFYLSELDGIYGEGMKKALLDFLKDKDIPLTDKVDEEIYKELNIILID